MWFNKVNLKWIFVYSTAHMCAVNLFGQWDAKKIVKCFKCHKMPHNNLLYEGNEVVEILKTEMK